VAHRRFSGVGLPVRVGEEADGGVERQQGSDGLLVVGIEGEVGLEAQDRVGEEHPCEAEGEERVGVGAPALFALGVNAAHPVHESLEGQEEAVARRLPTPEHPVHVVAEQGRADDDHQAEDGELEPPCRRHQSFSGRMSA
jgi:hypothetical protein